MISLRLRNHLVTENIQLLADPVLKHNTNASLSLLPFSLETPRVREILFHPLHTRPLLYLKHDHNWVVAINYTNLWLETDSLVLRCLNIYKALEQKMALALCIGNGNTSREQSELTSHLKSNILCLFVLKYIYILHYVKYPEGLA